MNFRIHAVVAGCLLSVLVGLTPGAALAARPGRVHPAVIGGVAAARGAFASVAFVSGQFSDGSGETCTGSVVSPDLVLTAGHCAENILTGAPYSPRDLMVITGRSKLDDTADGQALAVSRVWIDPAYEPPSETDDAALLELSRDTTAAPLQLAVYPDLGLLAAGTLGQVAGWGKTSGDAQFISQRLQATSLSVQSQTACSQAWGPTFDPDSQFCVHDDSTGISGVCNGDSGAPLIVSDGGTPTELGLASYVATGCSTTVPNVFVRSDVIAGWVEREIATVGNDGISAFSLTTDRMTQAVAYQRVKQILVTRFRRQLRGDIRPQISCVRVTRSGFLCSAAWQDRSFAFAGSIAVVYKIRNDKEFVTGRSTIKRFKLHPPS